MGGSLAEWKYKSHAHNVNDKLGNGAGLYLCQPGN